MSWTVKRHFVAKNVLAKHQDDLDRQQAQLDSFRREDVKHIHRDLKDINTPRKKVLDLNSPRRGTLPEVDLRQSIVLSKHPADSLPYTERVDRRNRNKYSYSSRRQSEPAADILRSLNERDVPKRACRLLEPRVNAEFQDFLQRAQLGIYGKENKHDVRQTKSFDNIPEYNSVSTGEVNILNLEDNVTETVESSTGEINILNLEGDRSDDDDAEERDSFKLEKLDLEQNIPSYALPRRRMSLPPNVASTPRNIIDTTFNIETTSKPNVARFSNRRASYSIVPNSATVQKYLYKRRGSWNPAHLRSGINVSFVDEYTGETDEGRYEVPNTYRDGCGDEPEVPRREVLKVRREEQKIWDDVAKCRYIRGYDPPEMKMPPCEANVYVFGRNLSESIEAQLSDKTTDPLETSRATKKK